jgi:hypothetical protein
MLFEGMESLYFNGAFMWNFYNVVIVFIIGRGQISFECNLMLQLELKSFFELHTMIKYLVLLLNLSN